MVRRVSRPMTRRVCRQTTPQMIVIFRPSTIMGVTEAEQVNQTHAKILAQ
jgi:hypothetical protein